MGTENKPFVLSLSKHERRNGEPFDKAVLSKPFTLREPQGERLVEGLRVNSGKYVFSIFG
jgi:hypothetical protein